MTTAVSDISANRNSNVSQVRTLVPKPKYDAGNGFVMRLSGPETPVAVGNFSTQLRQATALASLGLQADESILTGGLLPTDFGIEAKLRALNVTSLMGSPASVSAADYSSHIPDRSPALVMRQMTEHPEQTFAAAGMKLRPSTGRLEDGMRVMIQDPHSFPPLWFPVEVKVDTANQRVTFNSLDGHPLRGTNVFHFERDGAGTRINQVSRFQASSKLTTLGATLTGGLDRQHSVWRDIHAGLFKALVR